ASATNATLILSNVTPAQAGSYSVLVSNFYGTQLSAAATLTVVVPDLIVCGTNRTVELGEAWDFDAPVVTDAVAERARVYDNSVNDLLFRFDPGTLEVGDEIILSGPAEELAEFSFEFWGFGPEGGAF